MPYAPLLPYGPLGGESNLPAGVQVVDEVLSNLAKQFAPDGWLYEKIVAPIPVQYNFGVYPVFDPATFFQTGGNLAVADDAPTPIVDFNWSIDQYACQDFRLQTRITRKEMLQANPALRLDYSKTRGLLSVFANNKEGRLASQLRAQSNGGQFTNPAITPAVKWDAGTSVTPASIQADIQNAVMLAKKQCGKKPNTIVMDLEVAYAISNDYTIKDQLKLQVGPAIVTGQFADTLAGDAGQGILPAKLFGLNVLIADGPMYNTSRPGQANNLAATWGQSARVLYIDPNPAWGVPATVYSFRGTVEGSVAQPPQTLLPSDGATGQEPGGMGLYAVVDRWYDLDPPAEHIRAWECVTEKIVAPELGVEIQNVLSGTQYEY